MKVKSYLRLLSLAVLILMVVSGAIAQSGSSSIQGIVFDASGAVVPAANVNLINTATRVVLQATSGESGNYSFPSVAPGVYSLEVSKDGFASYKISQFRITVGQRSTENATLNIASSVASVTVDANGLSNLLDTSSNDLGTVIGPQSVQQLPLNGRNYLQLGLLSGAATQPAGAAAGSVNQTGHPQLAIQVAGNEPDYTMYVVNGLETVASRAGNTSLNLSMGAIDQFEVHYGFFMPDMGPNPGIVDVVTKSGTNSIHGEVYEYLRTNQMQARDYFALTSAGVPIAPGKYHQDQFGFDLGGPILHNKLFYFANYEGYRQNQQVLINATTPTAAMFSGDFSALSTPIYDPATLNPATGQRSQFPGNKIPANRFSSASAKLLNYYLPGAGPIPFSNNVGGNAPYIFNSDQFMGRIDYSLGPKHQIFAQGNWLNSPITSPGLFPGQGTAFPMDTELVNLGWNWTLSSSKVNELRMGMIRDSVYDEGVPVPGLEKQLNITGTADADGVPGIGLSNGYSGFGASTGLIGNLDNIYQLHDGFNWLHGNHQIKFGFQLSYLRTIQSSANANARGVFNFNGMFTAQTKSNGTGGYATDTSVAAGNSFADFLLGDLNSAQSIGMPRTHFRWTTAEPYIQDTWKIAPSLTANIALAWYGSTPPNAAGPDKNLVHGFDFVKGISTFAALGQMNPEVFPMTLTNWAPRIGFSWQPKGLKDTVVRAGWGLYYTSQEDVNAQYSIVSQVITVNNAVSNTQGTPTYVLGVNAMPAVTVGQITQTQANAITGPIQYLSERNRSPYVSQWNLDIQHTFASKYLLDAAYLGNESHHLAINWNPFDCSAPGSSLCLDSNNPYNGKYAYMQEVDSIGYGNYNALLIKFQRQYAHGFSLMANYIWAKALAAAQQGSNGTVNQRRSCLPGCDYGLTTSNIPQSFIVSTVVDLPVGRGKHFGTNMNWALDELVGGWSFDAIGTMQAGLPFTITAPNSTAWSPGQIRVNSYCNGRDKLSDKNIRSNGHYWFSNQLVNGVFQNETNGGCYVDPALDPANLVNGKLPVVNGVQARDAFGNFQFDGMTGPGLNNWDLGAHKSFTMFREIKFTLRGEFFNAWNHAQFANPNAGVNAGSSFGRITSTQHAARIIQVGGTFTF
jgi:hypothetical protein